jgi:hypothetical protein
MIVSAPFPDYVRLRWARVCQGGQRIYAFRRFNEPTIDATLLRSWGRNASSFKKGKLFFPVPRLQQAKYALWRSAASELLGRLVIRMTITMADYPPIFRCVPRQLPQVPCKSVPFGEAFRLSMSLREHRLSLNLGNALVIFPVGSQ